MEFYAILNPSKKHMMKKYAIEIKWGIIFFIVALLWMYLEKSLGWHDELIEKHAIYTNFFAILAILIYVIALFDKRANYYGGKMTYMEGFMSGMIISVVVAILTPLSQWITNTYITPDYFENAINYAIKSKGIDRETAESTFNLQTYIWMSFIFALVVGAITSAVVAVFTRKK